MKKTLVIHVSHEEVASITNTNIVLDFGTFINPDTKEEFTEEQLVLLEEQLLKTVTNKYSDLLAGAAIEKYARLYTKGLSAIYKSNQKVFCKVTFDFIEDDV